MSDTPKETAKKSAMPPSRIAVIVFALIAVVVVFVEMRARTSWDSTYQAVDKAMQGAKGGLYLKDVDDLIEGSPSREEDEQKETVLYTWSGVMQKYRMRLNYGPGGFVELIDQE